VELAPGDLVAVLTDGFAEWPNPAGERFGHDRVREQLRRHAGLSAAEVIRLTYEAVLSYAAGVPQQDDLTALVVKRQ
jgi:serine phosphatase RsbU (regulator of sigma subunit)